MLAAVPSIGPAQSRHAGDVDFRLSYPPAFAAVPGLAAWLDHYGTRLRAQRQREAVAMQQRMAAGFIPYRVDGRWATVAALPRFLSLSADILENQGGVHDNERYIGIVWDRQTHTARAPLSFFVSPAAFGASIRVAFCRNLAQQRRGGDQAFGEAGTQPCPAPEQQTLILGSSDHSRFDRIGILMEHLPQPGDDRSYEVTLPVTAAVMAAVRPEWRSYFATRGTKRS